MENIALPKKINFKAGSNPNEGTIVIEPLFPGYGMTLGNSLRRVLLSSLPGAAVVGVKVKGASHEFMALSGIKEDVLEIVLNLKQLRLRVFSEDEIRLEIKAKGKKTVTAADISKNSQVEIINSDLEIAHINDASGGLEIEMIVKEGRGYQMTEISKKDNREIGYMEIDAIFSPVLLVSVKVENTRVGKMTNWDKILLNIKTDGTISPEQAFDETVKILVDQFNALAPKEEKQKEKKEKKEENVKEEKETKKKTTKKEDAKKKK